MRGSGVAKRGGSCGGPDMVPYRKFSDIQWGELRYSPPPNPPKASKVGDEEANNARTLDGLGALGAPTADPQNQPERDAVVANDLTARKPVVRKYGAKALNLLKMNNGSVADKRLPQCAQAALRQLGAQKTGERVSTNTRVSRA